MGSICFVRGRTTLYYYHCIFMTILMNILKCQGNFHQEYAKDASTLVQPQSNCKISEET